IVLSAGFQAMLVSALDDLGYFFHLIGGNEIRPGANRGLPSRHHFFFRAEVVSGIPTLVFCRGITVKAIKAHEVSQAMAVVDELLHPSFGGLRPVAGSGLAALFYECPVDAEPSAVVVGLLADELLGITPGHHRDRFFLPLSRQLPRVLVELLCGAKHPN